jgi:hypothetical protein
LILGYPENKYLRIVPRFKKNANLIW